jgi:hypothetical protein
MLELKVTFEKNDNDYYVFGVWEGEHEITHASFANPPIKNNWESAVLLIATTVQGRLLNEKPEEKTT